jgi:glycosyltransferase involved in cell wall biosynthesis
VINCESIQQADLNHFSLSGSDNFPLKGSDLVCLSHLRWNFVYQRPQHLLSRCVEKRRVFFVEEPVVEFIDSWWLEISQQECGVYVVVPHLPDWVSDELITAMHQSLMNELFETYAIANPILWYYTPIALSFTHHLPSSAIVYDCMDELSAFKGGSPALQELERQLFRRADVVFTGGQSLYEAKQHLHSNIHTVPSSIDADHFAQARMLTEDPLDQRDIPYPRLGFYGVIDERLDLDLLNGIAQAKPDWHLVIVGPVVKIDPKRLPHHPNIHYLGGKSYQELPKYLAGWDMAMLPFVRNESTHFISPTKTPEYLAAGKPVVSTSIRDVVRPYGQQGLVQIADSVGDFIAATERALQQSQQDAGWLNRVDQFLAQNSWDRTWESMIQQVEAVSASRSADQQSTHSTISTQLTSKVTIHQSTRIPASNENQPLKRQINA